jgi:hypothetical protein
MDALDYEVVRVIDGDSLVDSESYQRRYRRRGAPSLAPGFYVVLWPDPNSRPHYDARAEFVGPFESDAVARAAMEGPRPTELRPVIAR